MDQTKRTAIRAGLADCSQQGSTGLAVPFLQLKWDRESQVQSISHRRFYTRIAGDTHAAKDPFFNPEFVNYCNMTPLSNSLCNAWLLVAHHCIPENNRTASSIKDRSVRSVRLFYKTPAKESLTCLDEKTWSE